MTVDTIQAEIDALAAKIEHYNRRYYIDSVSEISDYEFDMLLNKLISLEEQYPQFKRADSPSQRVGGGLVKEFETVKHKYPMLSLSNTYNEQEVRDFDERVAKTLESDCRYVCELKFDGVAISITYVDGVLTRAVTRGDGEQGDDVTANIKTIKSLPLRIIGNNVPKEFEVRGEVYISRENFQRLNLGIYEENKVREKEGKKPLPQLANPRNTASGTLKLQESKVVAQRRLDCFLYDLLGDQLQISAHSEALALMKSWGFAVSPTYRLCKSINEVWGYIAEWESKRFDLPLDTDGIVIKVDAHEQRKALGFTSKSPRWAIAYKYKSEAALATLESVDYQVGRTGAVTPVANLSPVELGGTVVKRASLHNANEMERLDLRLGDKVFVEKGGEIIPKITGVDFSARTEERERIPFPSHCPSCHTALVRAEGEAAFYCPNTKGCSPQVQGRIEHFIQRKAMDIAALGPETIEQLVKNKLVSLPSDLYTLQKNQLLTLDRFGEKLADKILQGIDKSKSVPFHRVLYALGIRFVGETVAEKLVNAFVDIDRLSAATVQELCAVPDIGERIAESVVSFFADENNRLMVSDLRNQGLIFVGEENKKSLSTKLAEKSFVVSGVFANFGRDEIKDVIKQNGGKVVSGVSSKVSFLLAGDKPGPDKVAKANELGVRILSESEFVSMLA